METMNKEIVFTCGLAFNRFLSEVILVKKDRGPSFNIGKWNGLGGKIERGEEARQCMAREFQEECGIVTEPSEWYGFHLEKHHARAEQTKDPRIHFMTIKLSQQQMAQLRKKESEEVLAFDVETVLGQHSDRQNWEPIPLVYNMGYLLPMALCWWKHPEHRWMEG